MSLNLVLKSLKILFATFEFTLTMGTHCPWHGGGSGGGSQPPNGTNYFQFEYDYMTGYNVFQGGDTYAKGPFLACNTELSIAYDESSIQPVSINWVWPILDTMLNHATLWPNSNPTDFVFDAYVMGMVSSNIPPNQNLDAFGITFRFPDSINNKIFMFSAIFMQSIQNQGGNVQALLEKVVIHELGHSRSRNNFTHSCEWNGSAWVSSPFHNDPACAMGMGRINQCNSIDLTFNPHFCPIDSEYIKKVTW